MKYDTVPSEILLESFKRLDCKERVRARGVCKEWLNIIDENRSLWRSLDCSVEMNDEAEPRALILFDEKSQSTLEDVSIDVTKVATHPSKGQNRILDRLFDTLGESSKTLQSVELKIKNGDEVKRAAEVLLNCPNLDTFMFFDPRYLPSNVAILQRKACNKNSTVERSKLQVLWTSLLSTSSLNCPRLLENLVSLAVEWVVPASEWREVLQASARSLKHINLTAIFSVEHAEEANLSMEPLNFPTLKVLEMNYFFGFPDWMIFPPTTILVLWSCDLQENLPSVKELWVSLLDQGLRFGKCCPLLGELRIQHKDLATEYGDAILGLLHEREKQVAIGLEVAGVKMVPMKRIVLPFKNCESVFLDEVRELVEEVVDLAEVPSKIPVYI